MARTNNEARSRGHSAQPTIPDQQTAELRAAVANRYPTTVAPARGPDGGLQFAYQCGLSTMKAAAAEHLLTKPGYEDLASAVGDALAKQSLLPKPLGLRGTLCDNLQADPMFYVGPNVAGKRQVKLNAYLLLSVAPVVTPAAGPIAAQTLMPTTARSPAPPTSHSTFPAGAFAAPTCYPSDGTAAGGLTPTASIHTLPALAALPEVLQKQQEQPDQNRKRVKQETCKTPAKRPNTGTAVVDTAKPTAAAAAVARLGGVAPNELDGVPVVAAAVHTPAMPAPAAGAALASTHLIGPLQLLPQAAQIVPAATAAAAVPGGVPTLPGQQQLTGAQPDVHCCHRCERTRMIMSMLDFGTAMIKAGAAPDTVMQLMPLEEAKQLAARSPSNT